MIDRILPEYQREIKIILHKMKVRCHFCKHFQIKLNMHIFLKSTLNQKLKMIIFLKHENVYLSLAYITSLDTFLARELFPNLNVKGIFCKRSSCVNLVWFLCVCAECDCMREENVVEKRVYCWIWGKSHIADGGKTWRGKTVDTNHARTKTTTTKRNPLLDGCLRRAIRRRRCCAAITVEWAARLPNQRSRLRIPLYLREKQPFGSNNAFVWISFFKCIICNNRC